MRFRHLAQRSERIQSMRPGGDDYFTDIAATLPSIEKHHVLPGPVPARSGGDGPVSRA